MLRRGWTITLLLAAIAIIGCSSGDGTDLSFQGGGVPPGDPDIGGVVVADEGDIQTAQENEIGIEGAEVVLFRGVHEVGRTQTGPGGYFRFKHPLTGNYALEVTPPEGSGLGEARDEFHHTRGQQTFRTIKLGPANGGEGPGPPTTPAP